MGLTEDVRKILAAAVKAGTPPVPSVLQGVTKDRVRKVLKLLDLETEDMVDVVFSLLDDRQSWFSAAPQGLRYCDGASTAQIGCHVGILQRGKDKLDREGRDYWIKPLRDIGAIEAVYFDSDSKKILAGHPKAKSPNSAYRLDADFVRVLQLPDGDWQIQVKNWIHGDTARVRLAFQAEQAKQALTVVGSEHADLIVACCTAYASKFLPGFEVLYVDDADGARVSEEEKAKMKAAGLGLELADAMPDVLLWNPKTDALWVIEAVTSDGEVDNHKVAQLTAFAKKHGKKIIDFTTAYPTWKVAAQRQGAHKNLAVGTFVWIREDASKQFRAETFPST
jgi:hypothetical protein